eukprot:TRINITY_DN11783_c0_g1_i1.p2 TRINITY_DN11783_c0_g1~~TRINITY_DN11783_c0_g1_i1.p2  ORF type:complete len:108 (+),score=9.20 TRINITY_DN11783_c0_g1_i1:381-704(+)
MFTKYNNALTRRNKRQAKIIMRNSIPELRLYWRVLFAKLDSKRLLEQLLKTEVAEKLRRGPVQAMQNSFSRRLNALCFVKQELIAVMRCSLLSGLLELMKSVSKVKS